MAIAWQSKEIRQYQPISENHAARSRGLGLKVSYVLLHQVDLILTLFAVSVGFSELNPVMRSLLHSPLQLFVFKLVIPLLIVWLVPSKFLIPALAFLALVVIWNVKEILLLVL